MVTPTGDPRRWLPMVTTDGDPHGDTRWRPPTMSPFGDTW